MRPNDIEAAARARQQAANENREHDVGGKDIGGARRWNWSRNDEWRNLDDSAGTE